MRPSGSTTPRRVHLAAQAGRAAGAVSRALGHGSGVTITGRVLDALAPAAMQQLAQGRDVVLVTGTNGKSTTSHLLTRAWDGGDGVTTNRDGANLRSGVLNALATSHSPRVVLEVDEQVLPDVLRQARPRMVLLLNLSRDQLDRVGEVSSTVRRWQAAFLDSPLVHVIANADDPLIVAAASSCESVTWVGAGALWRGDARTCPTCKHPLVYDDGGWACGRCGLARPPVELDLQGDAVVVGQERLPLGLRLPGTATASNASMALAACLRLGVPLRTAIERMRSVEDVNGRYATGRLHGRQVRLLLMKNPASGQSVFELLAHEARPLVLVHNAEAADGRDPSWLWDVPYEVLSDRPVVVSGRRAPDLSVRLVYAGVPHRVAPDVATALAWLPDGAADVVANYTAFTALSKAMTW